MITIELLKENKSQIIEVITETVGSEKVKEVMQLMVDTIGWNGIQSKDAVSFAKEVIKINNISTAAAQPNNTLWGPGCKYSTQSEYQRSCMGKKFN